MGPVMPLVALWGLIRDDFDCIWIGSRRGAERAYIEGLGIKYRAITSAKFRRYFDLRTVLAPIFVFWGFWESFLLLARFGPAVVVVSGSFVSMPLVWAAWLLGVRRIVHQEDLKIGLAGRATIPFASVVTTAFPVAYKKGVYIGNPVRKIFMNPKGAEKWKSNLPLIMVLGGGLGSEKINRAVEEIAPKLAGRARILCLTGKNKTIGYPTADSFTQIEGLWDGELAGAMAAADIMISRAGLSTLSELSALGKAAILIPLPDVGQEENAEYFEKRRAALIVRQDNLDEVEGKINFLLEDAAARKRLGANIKKIFPSGAAEKLAEIIYSVMN